MVGLIAMWLYPQDATIYSLALPISYTAQIRETSLDLLSARTLRLILAAWRPAASLDGDHPCGRTATALSLAEDQTLHYHDRLLDLFTLLAEVGEHF
jgi:hypothetical protein